MAKKKEWAGTRLHDMPRSPDEHGAYALNENDEIECQCGKTFATVDEWGDHSRPKKD